MCGERSGTRKVVGALGIALLVIAYLLAGGSELAVAGPMGTTQDASDEAARSLTAVLHVPVSARRVEVGALADSRRAGEFWSSRPDEYRLAPDVAASLRYGVVLAQGRRVTAPGLQTAVHELLHRAETYACWGTNPGGVSVEEGVVTAVTADVMPSIGHRATGIRQIRSEPPTDGLYVRSLAAIRAASARATGSPNWRTRAARLWRRELLWASCEGRAQMLGEVDAVVSDGVAGAPRPVSRAKFLRVVTLNRKHRRQARRLRRVLRRDPSVQEALTLASVVYGVPRSELSSVAWCESRHRPSARNGRYRGLFQQGSMFEATPYGRAGLSVWSPYAAALSTAYVVSRQGWRQWQCRPGGRLAW